MNTEHQVPQKGTDSNTSTSKEKIGTFVSCLVLVAIGVCVWIWPDFEHQVFEQFNDGEIHGHGSRKVVFWLGLIWNRPIGTILGIFGAFMLYGLFSKSDKTKKPAE